MKVCVFGLWHLGLVISAGLAKKGHCVTGLDLNSVVVDELNTGKTPISEPGLDALILENMQNSRLRFTSDPSVALKDADALWISFDTPVDENDVADPDYIRDMFFQVAEYVPDRAIIIISSQVPVGFTKKIRDMFRERYSEKAVAFCYSPENLRLGKALQTFLDPDRIVIGSIPAEKELFIPIFSSVSSHLEWMGIESAEMTKHAINSFLASSICFANEIASLCECTGADAGEVERGLKTEARIGPKAYLSPGNAFSGGTLARDVRFLKFLGTDCHQPLHLIGAVLDSNEYHKTWVRRKCVETLGPLTGKRIAVLGLTYKPGTNTLRRSLAVELCSWLHDQGCIVIGFDPSIKSLPSELTSIIAASPDIDHAVTTADCIIIATEWPQFREIRKEILSKMQNKIIIDPNGFIETSLGEEISSVQYYKVGRGHL